MRVNDVSHITQRMVFLRVYEILVEANQSVLDKRDLPELGQKNWQHYDAGYPFCYFTGEVLDDLLQQPIVWHEQHLSMELALRQEQPDLDHWLTDDVRALLINDFFAWQPHTLRVQQLVDDVKERVLDVVDAIHSAERIQQMVEGPRLLHVLLPDKRKRKIMTGGLSHSLSYRVKGQGFEPVVHDAAEQISPKWHMHALIHGMWLVGQEGGHVRLDAHDSLDTCTLRAPLYLV